MTELDERLAEALREAVPEPPHQLNPETIRARSGERRRTVRRYAPALAAAAVVAIAVTVAITRGGGGSNNTRPATVGDPRKLVGVTWRIQTPESARPRMFQADTLTIKPNGEFWQNLPPGCVGFAGRLSITSTELIVQSAHPDHSRSCLVGGTGHAAEQRLLSVMQQMFTGSVAWSIEGDQLTLSKDGGPTVVYTRWRPLFVPGSLVAAVELDRVTAPANGEPISGLFIVDNGTRAPITISDACNGWYRVGLENDQIRFVAGWTQMACGSDELPIGFTSFPISVRTTYENCSMRGPEPSMPACIGPSHSQPPPLPPGDYTVSVGFRGLSHDPTLEPPLHLTLTAP